MRFALRFPSLFFVFCIEACEPQAPERQVESSTVTGRSGADSVPAVTRKPDTVLNQALACSPTTFGRGDTVTVRMKTPHAEYLGINDPDGTPFFIIYPGDEVRKDSRMPSEVFKNISTFLLPADIKARPWVANREVPEPVFTRPGTYTLLVGHLETDHGTPPDKCTLRFQG